MTTEPWLSVVVPWWNRVAYARETLDSMARQTDKNFECIIVDQQQESVLRALEAYAGRFEFRLVTSPQHSDWPSKTNVGFTQARGRYVCMLHTDDVWRCDRVARLREAHRRNPEAGLLFHAVRFIDPASRALGEWHAPLAPDRLLESSEVLEHLIIQNFISCPAPVLRRDVVGAGIDPKLWYTGDWDLYLRVVLATSAVYVDEPLADFRLHTTSLTMQRSRSTLEFQHQLDCVLERFGGAVPSARREELLRIARFSNAVNVALAAAFHGSWGPLLRVLLRAKGLGLADWRRYLIDSRILERTSARLKLARQSSRPPLLPALGRRRRLEADA